METGSWKSKAILIGTLAGAITGFVAASILVQRAEKQNSQPKLSASEGVKLGMGVLGLLKLIADYGEKK